MQDYRFAIAGGVEPYDEQVEVAEVKGERDQQLPADLESFQEKPACQGQAWLGRVMLHPFRRRMIQGIALQVRQAVQSLADARRAGIQVSIHFRARLDRADL